MQRTNIKITSDSTKLVLNIDQGANSGIWYNLIGTNSFQWIFYLLKSGWTALTVISNSVVFAYRDSTFGNMILQKLTISSGFSTDWVMSALNTTSNAIGCSSSVYDPTYSTLYFSMIFDLTYMFFQLNYDTGVVVGSKYIISISTAWYNSYSVVIYNECIYALIDWTSSQYIFQFSSGGFYSRYFSISSLFNWNYLVSAGDFLYLL